MGGDHPAKFFVETRRGDVALARALAVMERSGGHYPVCRDKGET